MFNKSSKLFWAAGFAMLLLTGCGTELKPDPDTLSAEEQGAMSGEYTNTNDTHKFSTDKQIFGSASYPGSVATFGARGIGDGTDENPYKIGLAWDNNSVIPVATDGPPSSQSIHFYITRNSSVTFGPYTQNRHVIIDSDPGEFLNHYEIYAINEWGYQSLGRPDVSASAGSPRGVFCNYVGGKYTYFDSSDPVAMSEVGGVPFTIGTWWPWN